MAQMGKRDSGQPVERTDGQRPTDAGGDGSSGTDRATTVPAPPGLSGRVRAVLGDAWRPAGYTSPNLEVYPWQWLWDSCFHAIVWSRLGDERAIDELANVFARQDETGFVPHMTYWGDESFHADFWGREGSSSITQPPMFGHAVACLARDGLDVPESVTERARAGLVHLLHTRPRRDDGLVPLLHPWESGADDDPRWDHFCPGGFEVDRWREQKGLLVGAIERTESGAPVRNPRFEVASMSFNALVAFNAAELGRAIGDEGLVDSASELARSIDRRWDPAVRTWVDAGASAATSGRVRSLGGLLPVLCSSDPAALELAFSELLAPDGHGGSCGPAGVHRSEPCYAPTTYWRGPAWPQLTYLFWVAADRAARAADAKVLAVALARGAEQSAFAEYWEPDSGEALGAVPQSWATLALLVTH